MYADHIRLTLQGRLGTPQADRFSFGVNLMGTPTFLEALPWISADNGIWQDMRTDCVEFFQRTTTRISPAAVLDMVKIAQIKAGPGPDTKPNAMGHYGRDPIIFEGSWPGGGTNNTHVLPQTALVVSLNTDRRGPSGRGRFFLPMPFLDVLPTDGFRAPAAEVAQVNASAEQWIQALNNLPGIDTGSVQVCVASTRGYNTPVASVRTGRVLDTMRSRRNKLQEFYSPDLDVD